MDNAKSINIATLDHSDPMTTSKLLASDSQSEQFSDIEPLVFPDIDQSEEAKLLIADHKDEITPMMEYIINKLDYISQDNQYIKRALSDISKQARKTNGKVVIMTSWHQANDQRLANTMKIAEDHEENYRKFITSRDLVKIFLTTLASLAAGALVWIELFGYFTGK